MKKKKDSIKVFRYFSHVKGWLFVLIFVMFVSALIDVFNPIISANLVTYLTDFSYKKAITFALLLLLVSLLKVLVNESTYYR